MVLYIEKYFKGIGRRRGKKGNSNSINHAKLNNQMVIKKAKKSVCIVSDYAHNF